MSTSFTVEGMTCGGCRNRVAAALAAQVPGTEVTLDPPLAVFPAMVDREAMNAALAAIGKYRLGEAVPEATKAMAEPARVATTSANALPRPTWATYYPLALIAAYLVVISFAGTGMGDHVHKSAGHIWMTNFMAGFFLLFSFFKLLDIRGFADAYAGYDLVAERWRPWGLLYPFVELGLGLAYLFRLTPNFTTLVTLIVMGVSILGVIRALLRRQQIRCACLGTVLNLPMSTVTLIEDGLMIAMAAFMLIVAA
ncbi:MAG: heavy-metal-associated domain-containing protein [Bosea sp. (in: a-proteobacteria)]